MNKIEFIYWEDGNMWLGYIKEYPDYWSQGETYEELKDNLRDIYKDLISGEIQNARRVGELEIM